MQSQESLIKPEIMVIGNAYKMTVIGVGRWGGGKK